MNWKPKWKLCLKFHDKRWIFVISMIRIAIWYSLWCIKLVCVCVDMSNTINLRKIQVTSMYNKSKHVLYWLLIDESWSGKKKSASCRAICFNVTACKRGQKYKPQLNRSRSKKTNSFSCVCVWFNYGLPSYDCAFFRST